MKELDDDFLKDYFREHGGVAVDEHLNERIMAHIESKVSARLADQRLLIWSCVGSVLVALGGLIGYLYYIGAIQFKAIEISSTDVLWLFVGCCAMVFMVLSLYLSRRFERGRA